MMKLALGIGSSPNMVAPVKKMADTLGYRPAYFSRVFKRVVGEAPRDFIVRVRLERAQRLLTKRLLTIKKIAERLGYRNAYFFSHQFKAKVGLSPSAYRRAALRKVPASSRAGTRKKV